MVVHDDAAQVPVTGCRSTVHCTRRPHRPARDSLIVISAESLPSNFSESKRA